MTFYTVRLSCNHFQRECYFIPPGADRWCDSCHSKKVVIDCRPEPRPGAHTDTSQLASVREAIEQWVAELKRVAGETGPKEG